MRRLACLLLLTSPLLAADLAELAGSGQDASPTIQAMLDAASAAGGGVVAIPAGKFQLGTALQARDRVILRGAGMGVSVLEHPEGVRGVTGGGKSARERFAFCGFEDLTFRGTWDQHPKMGGDGDRHIAVNHVDHLWMVRCEGVNGMQMGFTAGYCGKVEVLHCRIVVNARDGINLTGSRKTQVMFNEIRHCWDDAIAIHSNQWAGAPPAGEHQVAFNNVEDSFGIKLLGANKSVISNNVVTRPKGYGLWIGGYQPQYHEGNNDVTDVQVTDNVINDPISPQAFGSNQVVNHGIWLGAPKPSTGTDSGLAVPPGQFDGQVWLKPEDWTYRSSIVGSPFSGGWRIRIAGNVIAKTLPNVQKISELGYQTPVNPDGLAFHCDGWKDIPLAGHIGSGAAVTIAQGASQELTIADNVIEGWRDGTIFHSNPRLWQVDVTGNRFIRISRAAVLLGKYPTEDAPARENMLFRLAGNVFDLDPYLEHENRNPDGTWKSGGSNPPAALDASLVYGVTMTGNTFRNLNVAVHGAGPGQFVSLSGNHWFGEFTGPGDRGDNRGVRRLSLSEGDTVTFEGSNPANSNYRQLLGGGPADLTASKTPTTGGYVTGQFVRCSAPQVRDGKLLTGWVRLTTGLGHEPGTDWAEVWAATAP